MEFQRLRELEKRKKEILKRIEFTEKAKKDIINLAQGLVSQLNYRKITREEYEEKLKEALKGKTSEQWLEYYEKYLTFCKEQLRLCEKEIKKEKRSEKLKYLKGKAILILTILIVIVLISLLVSLFFILKPVGTSAFKNIGKKILTSIEYLTEKAPEIEKEIPQVFEEPKVPVSLENKQAKLSEESLIQEQAVLGKNVRWKKQFKVERTTGFSIELPKDSENIKIKTIKDGEEKDITGIAGISKKRRFFIFEKAVEVEIKEQEAVGITGAAISDAASSSVLFEIYYETPAPEISELEAEGRVIKKILIKGPEDVHYKNILSFTELPREFSKNEIGKLKLYEIKQNQRIKTEFIAYDTDENELYDYAEWLTPELSEAVFEFVIEISKAEHLDFEKNFISDIYNEVYQLDGIWSKAVNDGEYVRVTFFKKLDSTRDITLYPRIVSGNPLIEVYEIDGSEKIAEFTNLQSNQYNKVYLNNLKRQQDVFDLKIINGEIEIEHIIDPVIAETLVPDPTNNLVFWGELNDNSYVVDSTFALPSEGYSVINTSNNNAYFNNYGSPTKDPYYWVNFMLPPSQTINSIFITTESNNTAGNDYVTIALYNFSSSTWVEVNRSTAVTSTEKTLTYNLTTNWNNFISSNVLRVMAATQGNSADDMYLDYIGIVINYLPAVPGFSSPAINETTPFLGMWINHSVIISNYPTQYLFEWNGSGANCDTWANSSWVTVTGSSVVASNVSYLNSNCKDKIIAWRFWGNNSGGQNTSNWNYYIVNSYGNLIVNLTFPFDNFVVQPNNTFDLNATVTCSGGANAKCGIVYASARYNSTTATPDTNINTTKDSKPFYVIGESGPINSWNWSGDLGGTDIAYGVATDSNNNFIVVGSNDTRKFIMKFNSNNENIWNYSTGSETYTNARGVATDSNNNFIVAGEVGGLTGNFNIMKFNSNNENIWNYSTDSGNTDAYGVATDSNNNFIAVGYSESKWFIMKFNSNNENIWNYSANLGGTTNIAYGVATDSNNNFIAVGRRDGSGWFIMKFNSNNENIWNYSANLGGGNYAWGVATDSNNNFIVAGLNGSGLNIMKFNSDNVNVWNYSREGFGDSARGVTTDSNNNFIVVGAGNLIWRVMKFNSDNVNVWNYSANLGGTDIAYGVATDSNNNFIVAGRNGSGWFIMRFDVPITSLNPQFSSSVLSSGDIFNVSWAMNATGSNNTVWKLGVLFNSSYGSLNVPDNHTNNVTVMIGGPSSLTCGNLDVANKVYTLTADIENNDLTGPCINITAQNITFDCNGFYIKSDDPVTGVYSNQLNTTIKNCNISMGSGSGGYGIYILNANKSNIYNNILNGQQRGIYLYDSFYNILADNIVDSNSQYGIYIDWGDHNIIKDSEFTNSGSLDLNINSVSINNTFLNATYSISKEFVCINCELIRKWYYQANVTDINSFPIINANVSAYNKIGIPTGWQFNLTTKADGFTNITSITDYINNGTRNYYSLYTINTRNGSLSESHNLNVTERALQAGFGGLILDNIVLLPGPIEVTSCRTLDLANTIYTLTANVNSTDTCFNITANNVTLDCKGKEINYSSDGGDYEYGVYSDKNFTTIKNCNITEGLAAGYYDYGIYLDGASNGTIDNNTITTSGLYGRGILLSSSSTNTLSNNSITTSGFGGNGIYLYLSSNSNITGNIITTSGYNGYGIYLYISSNSNTLSSNTITTSGSSGYGTYLQSNSNSNTLSNNTITTSGSDGYGIYLASSSLNNLTNNKANSSQSQSYVISGTSSSHFNNTIGNDNLAEGKPVNYTYNVDNLVFDEVDFTQYGQVIFSYSRNITIRNSNFSYDSLNLFYTNTSTITNNRINTSKGYGLVLLSSSNLNNISNNNITTSGGSGYGIYLYISSNSNTLSSNTITTSGSSGFGIYLYSSSNSNTLSNNTITTSGSDGYGIYLYPSSNSNTLSNNTITTSGSSGFGIYLYSSSNTLSSNTLKTSGIFGYGIYLYSSSNTLLSNTIITSGSFGFGIYLSSSSLNNSFSGMNVRTNGSSSYGIYIYYANSNFIMTDSILNSSYAGVQEIYVASGVTGGIWNFTNVTRANGSLININWIAGANGTLNMKWYLDVNVTDASGNAVENANVTAWNRNNVFQFSVNTTATGFIPRQTLLEYTNVNNTLKTYFSNYTVNTTKTGYANNSQKVNMSANRRLDVVLVEEAGTGVASCRELDNANTLYTQTANIENNDLTGPCINITAQNITFDCNGFYIKSDDPVTGVYSNQLNTTIKNCNINVSKTVGGRGIQLVSGARNSYVYNNKIAKSYSGIDVYSDNSIIESNTVSDAVTSCIAAGGGGDNITVINNSVTKCDGIQIYSTSLSRILNNFISNLGGSCSYGFSLISSADNNLFENNVIKSCNYGINLGDASDNLFKDINISGSSNYDVYSGNFATNNTFLNVSYNISKEYVEAGSELIRKWYYQANVTDGINPVINANLSAYNKTNNWQFNLSTFPIDISGISVGGVNLWFRVTGDYTLLFIPGSIFLVSENDPTNNGVYTVLSSNYDGYGTWIITTESGVGHIVNTNGYVVSAFTPRTEIIDYINNGTRNYYSLYTINTRNGSLSESHNLNVTERALQAGFGGAILDNIVLDAISPSIIFVPPTPDDGWIQAGNSIFVNVSASDIGRGNNNISTFIDFDNSLVAWWRMDDLNASGGIVDSGYYCYDNETRVMTSEGWKYFKDVELEDEILTLNATSGETEWYKPSEKQDFAHEGEMYRIEVEKANGEIGELVVSPEHKVYVGVDESSSANSLSENNLKILPLNSFSEDNNLDIVDFCDSKSLAGILNNQIPKCLEETNLSSIKCLSRVINSLCSNKASLKTSPFSMLLGQSLTSCPNLVRKEYNPLCTFSSNKNFILCWKRDCEVSFSNLCSEVQSSLNMFFVQRGVCFEDFFSSSLIFKHFQNYRNHDPSSLKSRLSMTDVAVNNNKLINFNSHKKNEESQIFKLFYNRDLTKFKLEKISEIYDNLENNAPENKQLFFLDEAGNEVKVKSIKKEQYSGRIYDVDVANDIILVERNGLRVWSGNSNNGTAYGNAVQTDAGKLGKGFEFDGADDGIILPSSNLILTQNKTFTISTWFNAKDIGTALANFILIFHRGSSPSLAGAIEVYGGNSLGWEYYNGTSQKTKVIYNNIQKNEWYHVTVTYNGTDFLFYLNGALGPIDNPSTDSFYGFGSFNAKIGYSDFGWADDFNGTIDDVMIFNRSLSAEEIRGLYANTSSRYLGVNFTSLSEGSHTFKAYSQDTAGNINSTEKREVFVSFAPRIIYVQDLGSVRLEPGAVKNVSFNFTVYDFNGFGDLNDSSARANFTRKGVVRNSINCSMIVAESSGNYANYSCKIGMWYFDEAGFWNITVAIADNSQKLAINDSTGFYYNEVGYFDILPYYINWSDVQLGQEKKADNNMSIINLGNVNILDIMINATQLNGTQYPDYNISVSKVSVNISISDFCNGYLLSESQNVSFNLFVNYSESSEDFPANKSLGFCLKPLSNIPAQVYKSARDWEIDVVFEFVLILIKTGSGLTLAVAVIAKKRRKKKDWRDKGSLREKWKYIDFRGLLELDASLKEKYKLGIEEILEIAKREKVEEKTKEETQIPVSVFNQEISPAEALCKYLKENRGLKFSEIAKLINRDERGVWTNYRNAVKKMKEEIKEEERLLVPLSIFSDRRLSVLESVVKHLKEEGFRNSEIAKLLGKDQRNIYTLYSRAKKKLLR